MEREIKYKCAPEDLEKMEHRYEPPPIFKEKLYVSIFLIHCTCILCILIGIHTLIVVTQQPALINFGKAFSHVGLYFYLPYLLAYLATCVWMDLYQIDHPWFLPYAEKIIYIGIDFMYIYLFGLGYLAFMTS